MCLPGDIRYYRVTRTNKEYHLFKHSCCYEQNSCSVVTALMPTNVKSHYGAKFLLYNF